MGHLRGPSRTGVATHPHRANLRGGQLSGVAGGTLALSGAPQGESPPAGASWRRSCEQGDWQMTSAAQVRARLDHPVIDADGHTVEFMPAVREVLSSLAGGDVATKLFENPTGLGTGWYRRSPEQ